MQVPGQLQRGSGEGSEGSREDLGGFGAEPGHVQNGSGEGEGLGGFGSEEGSGEGSGEGLGGFGAKARSGSTGFRRRFWEALERVLEKVAEKGWVALVQPGQVQQGSGEGLGGFARQGQVQQGSGEGSGESVGGFGAEPGWV